MAQLITLLVSEELADEFEAQAHLLAPARIVKKDTESNPCWWTYTLDWPGAPPGAASVLPIWRASYEGAQVTVELQSLEWYDGAGHAVPVD